MRDALWHDVFRQPCYKAKIRTAYVMREFDRRLVKWFVIVVAIAVAAIILLDGTPQHVPLGSRASTLCSVLEYQYHKLGLLPPSDMNDFYSSILGTRFRSLSDRLKVIGGTAQDIGVQSDTSDDAIRLTVIAEIVVPNGNGAQRKPFFYKRDWHKNPYEQTRCLLSIITAGTKQWRTHLPNGPAIDHAFPESEPVSLPDIGFDRPRTEAEMQKYSRWLARMAGSSRLRDGWNRRVLLELDDSKTIAPILNARSAGPDGRWQTDDDIVLRRDVDTGRVVFRKGFGTAKRDDSSSE